MIITRSPLRISLGGGGTDLPSYYREHTRLPHRGGDRQVRLHHAAPRRSCAELIIKYSKLERVTAIDEIEHPIIREALRLVGRDRRRAGNHLDGRHPGGHRPRVVGQLHDRAAQGAAHAQAEPRPPGRARRAGLRHRARKARRTDRQAGSVHRGLRRHHLLSSFCPTAAWRRWPLQDQRGDAATTWKTTCCCSSPATRARRRRS